MVFHVFISVEFYTPSINVNKIHSSIYTHSDVGLFSVSFLRNLNTIVEFLNMHLIFVVVAVFAVGRATIIYSRVCIFVCVCVVVTMCSITSLNECQH